MRVLFVCLGNICRSPTAEGVLRARLAAEGMLDRVAVDSCGVGSWHVGAPPDSRAQQAARSRGIELSGLRGRQLDRADFDDFDYLLAMDRDNLTALERQAPRNCRAHVGLFMAFAGEPQRSVPDPYYEGGFDGVYEMIERATDGLVADLKARLGETP